MANIWKDLLFLHGHFVRVEDLAETVSAPAAAEAAAVPADTTRRSSIACTPQLAGGCA